MSVLFDPIVIGNMEIQNRFMRSATYFGLADIDGFVGDAGANVLKTLAENDVGLIVAGYAYVLKNGQRSPDMNGIQDDDHIPGYQKMTRAVHDAGGKVVLQIVHAGAMSTTTARTDGDYMAVSPRDNLPDFGKKPREMTDEDIESIIEAFGQAARRVQEAGFDGVQLHGAHEYLIAEFLSPRTNLRTDKWGGSLENRMRFVVEVTRAVKKAVHEDFPVMIKLGCRDYPESGPEMTIEEGAVVAAALEKEGHCSIELSYTSADPSQRKKTVSGHCQAGAGSCASTGSQNRQKGGFGPDRACYRHEKPSGHGKRHQIRGGRPDFHVAAADPGAGPDKTVEGRGHPAGGVHLLQGIGSQIPLRLLQPG